MVTGSKRDDAKARGAKSGNGSSVAEVADAVGSAEPARRRVHWRQAYRLIPSRFPPIDLFERVAEPADWEMLHALESLTNPRLRDAAGVISLVPAHRRVAGPGATVVMAPFTHVSPNRASRFTDGTFGVYYAGKAFETALLEVSFHMGRFHAATADLPATNTFRAYKGSVDAMYHDIRGGEWSHVLAPEPSQYPASQAFGKALREAGSNGIVYPSVRHAAGECIAAFWPDVVGIPVQDRHVQMRWDGKVMSGWLEYRADDAPGAPKWKAWPG